MYVIKVVLGSKERNDLTYVQASNLVTHKVYVGGYSYKNISLSFTFDLGFIWTYVRIDWYKAIKCNVKIGRSKGLVDLHNGFAWVNFKNISPEYGKSCLIDLHLKIPIRRKVLLFHVILNTWHTVHTDIWYAKGGG